MTGEKGGLVEGSSAASRSMSEEAGNMNNLISFFRLGQQSQAGAYATHSAHSRSEPIQTYKPATKNAPAKARASAARPGTGSGNTGAASFSSGDEWEDF